MTIDFSQKLQLFQHKLTELTTAGYLIKNNALFLVLTSEIKYNYLSLIITLLCWDNIF